jgi:hypothetical protein
MRRSKRAPRNVARLRGVHGARSKAYEKLGSWSLRAKQLRRCGNAHRLRRIAAADRRARRDAANLGPRNARRAWCIVDGTESEDAGPLYVSTFAFSEGGSVSVFSYPGGRLVGTLAAFTFPSGLCSDEAGNVFVVDASSGYILEYAHGRRRPIATFDDSYYSPHGCAVDPTTGDLAVAGGSFPYGNGANVAIFTDPNSPPMIYYDENDLTFAWCTYDDQGNLFANGRNFPKGESGLAELSKGSSAFNQMRDRGCFTSTSTSVKPYGTACLIDASRVVTRGLAIAP